jgi:hypothetical protein
MFIITRTELVFAHEDDWHDMNGREKFVPIATLSLRLVSRHGEQNNSHTVLDF